MKKVISALLISIATLAVVGVWAQTKSVTIMSDSELKAAIDSLVELEQPLTAAPLIAEAKSRAAKAHDTKWMLSIIKQDIELNGRRLSRESSAVDMLDSYRKDVWTPLRQVISAECYAVSHDRRYAADILSCPDELRKIKASELLGDDIEESGDLNLLDYLAVSLSVANKYDAREIDSQSQVHIFNAPYKEFAASTDSLPFVADAARVVIREGLKAGDDESVAIGQALRVVLASYSAPLLHDSLLAELLTMKPDGCFASNIVEFAKASALLAGISQDPDDVKADNEKIDEAIVILDGIKAGNADTDSVCGWMRRFAQSEVDAIKATELYVKSQPQVMPIRFLPLFFSYRNIGKVKVSVYRIGDSISDKPTSVDMGKVAKAENLVMSKDFDLPQTRSMVSLSSSYAELGGLGNGYYLLTASSADGVIKAYTTFFCSSIAPNLVSVGSKDYLQISDFESGAPRADVKVSGKSSPGKDGWMQWQNKDNKIEASSKGDFFFARAYSYSSRGERRQTSEKAAQFITDRRIYRPGQSILFKVYFYDSFTDRVEPLGAGKDCSVKLYGANGKELAVVKAKLDEFGAASGKLDIPADVVKGGCRIAATCGRVSGGSYIQVEDFKRTDNSVVVSPFTDVVLPGAEAVVKGSCVSAAGLPVSNASVVYEVSGDDSKLHTGECLTADDGSFSFSFKVVKAVYNIHIRVTDGKGETAESSTLLRVNPSGYDVKLSLADAQTLIGQGPRVTLSSLNANGRPYHSQVRLTVTPYEPVKGLRPALYDKVDTVIGGQCSVIFGKASFANNDVKLAPTPVHDKVYDVDGECEVDLSELNLPARRYRVVASAVALDSSKIEAQSDYVALADKGKMDGLDYLLLDVPESVKAGETLNIRVGSGLDDAYVTVLLSKANSLVLRKQVRLSRSVEKLSYDVPADCVNDESLRVAAFLQKDGSSFSRVLNVNVRKDEEQLKLSLTSFRDHSVPGAKETWTISCVSPADRTIAASMYDSRLDKYVDNSWSVWFRRLPVSNRLMFGNVYVANYNVNSQDADGYYTRPHSYDSDTDFLNEVFDWLRYESGDYYQLDQIVVGYGGRLTLYESVMPSLAIRGRRMNKSASAKFASAECAVVEEGEAVEESADAGVSTANAEALEPLRENFDETVFFSPSLTPDADGNATFEFTLPDNLTTYNFRALAVDKQMRSAIITRTLTVAKPVNVQIGLPRFATEGDSLSIPVSVAATDSSITSVKVSITISDNATKRVLLSLNDVSVEVGGAKSVRTGCDFVVPEGVDTLAIEAVCAASTGSSDGERRLLPVAKRNLEVEESSSFVLTGKGTHKLSNPFTDGKTKTLTFNYTSNAFIEVLRALPSLDNSFAPCADTYLGRYESSAIAALLQQRPDIQKAVKYIKENDGKLNTVGDADNNIWYLVAQRLAKHDRDVVKLLSGSYASRVKDENLRKLSNLQLSDGSFPWFSGMDGSEFMTVAIASTLGEMQMLGLVSPDDMPSVSKILTKARPYLDARLAEQLARYEKQVKANKEDKSVKRLSSFTLTTLQARVLMGDYASDKAVSKMIEVLKDNWQYPSMCDRVTALSVLTHTGNNASARTILKSLEENLVQTKDGTAFIPENGLFHRREQVEAQAMLIIALQRLNPQSPNAQKVINHLVLMKRGEAWPDAQSTSRAVLALLASSASAEETDVVEVGDISATCSVEKPEVSLAIAADGTVKKAKVEKSGSTTSWGAWQRIMKSPIDELDASGDSKLKVTRALEVRRVESGNEVWLPVTSAESLKVGDKVRVTLKFYNDEALSFVRLRDFRTAAAEPDDKLSGYRGWWFWRWTDANISTPCHYLSISDDKTEFFIDYLYEGWHSVSYTATITHNGDFAGGYADAQCMYVTEIMAHSEGCRLSVAQ